MKKITILIPHNKSPYLHDLFTIQCNNVLRKLELQFNLGIVWALFPPAVAESKDTNLQTINARHYPNAVKILESINPDIVLINGSVDFHNVEIALAAKYKKIPVATFFFRNIITDTTDSSLDIVRVRLRGLFSNKVHDAYSTKDRENRLKWFRFYLKQFCFLHKTLQAVNYRLFQQINFLIHYAKTIMFCPIPLHQAINGSINLCSVSQWIDRLSNQGFVRSSIFPVGDPYFDLLCLELQKNKQSHPHHSDKTKILFCTSTMHQHDYCSKNEEYELIRSTIREVLKYDKEFEIAVKIHPSTASKEEFTKEILKKLPTKIDLYQKENLADLINQYDMIISYGGSGAILYGVLLGKPVVNLQFNTRATGNNVWIDDNLITKCENFDDLKPKIIESKKRIFLKQHYDNFIKRNIGFFDGKSSERIASMISNLLNNNQR